MSFVFENSHPREAPKSVDEPTACLERPQNEVPIKFSKFSYPPKNDKKIDFRGLSVVSPARPRKKPGFPLDFEKYQKSSNF